MKIAFSNIAWDGSEQEKIFSLLREGRVEGIEIAPTKIWPDWVGATAIAARSAGQSIGVAGFSVPSMQAILFGRPELKVFGSHDDRHAFLRHIDMVANIAREMGAKTLVFGSPANRDPGDLPPDEAMTIAVSVMSSAGDICARHGVWLGIEANPAVYGCRFLTHWFEAAELVHRCNNPGVRFHLDAACTHLASDDLADAVSATKDILAHVHISEPHLGSFDKPSVDHARFGNALREAGYRGWCSVEMRRAAEPESAIRLATQLARSFYG